MSGDNDLIRRGDALQWVANWGREYKEAYREIAALPADPRVAKLVEALKVYGDPCDATETTPCGYKGHMCCKTARAALAAWEAGT